MQRIAYQPITVGFSEFHMGDGLIVKIMMDQNDGTSYLYSCACGDGCQWSRVEITDPPGERPDRRWSDSQVPGTHFACIWTIVPIPIIGGDENWECESITCE